MDIFSAELTKIPSLLNGLQLQFDNTICNITFWLGIFWFIINLCYNKFINVYLKYLGFPQYLRSRLGNSLWMISVSVSYLTYFHLILTKHSLWDVVNFKKSFEIQPISFHEQITHHLICSFYIFMGCKTHCFYSFGIFASLVSFCVSAYVLRYFDALFTFTAVLAFMKTVEEFSRIWLSLLKKKSINDNKLINTFIGVSSILSIVLYLVICPFGFLIPLAKFDGNFYKIIIFLSILLWLNLSIYKSVILSALFHYFYHKDVGSNCCEGGLIECTMFPKRTDDGYVLTRLRAEIQERQKLMMAKRKPKNRSMVIQTLKCMMVIKNKLSEKFKKNTAIDDEEDEETETDDESSSEVAEEEEGDEPTEETPIIKKADKACNLIEPKQEHKSPANDVEEPESEIKTDNLEETVSDHAESCEKKNL